MGKEMREERAARQRTSVNSVKKPLERRGNWELLVRASDFDKDQVG